MHIIFLIKTFKLNKCGLSDYINISSNYFKEKKIENSILFSNNLKNNKQNQKKIKWSIFNIIKEIRKIPGNKIFFFQFSPFLQSKSGFSLKLISVFFILKFFNKDTKIVLNFHETANKFNLNPKYLLMYFSHLLQMYLLFFFSHKVYYTNDSFLKRFKFLGLKKSDKRDIFSNIEKISIYKKKYPKNFIFFLSHYNYKNFIIMFDLIKKYNLINKNKIYLNFLGNSSKSNIIKTKNLLRNFSLLIYSRFFINIRNKKFSEILNHSIFTVATRKGIFEQNSGFHKASLIHGHYILQINKNIKYKINNSIINVKKMSHFNFIINKLYNDNNVKKKFSSDRIILNNFLYDFHSLLND